jgi:hypothetical protein
MGGFLRYKEQYMVTLTQVIPEDWEDDDEYDDEYYFGDYGIDNSNFTEPEVIKIKGLIPPDWILIKIAGYKPSDLKLAEDWCRENITEDMWKRVGWRSGCSSRVGLGFGDRTDAALFVMFIGGENL